MLCQNSFFCQFRLYCFVEKNFGKKIKTTTTDFELLFQGCRLPIEPWESPFLCCFVYIPIIPLFAAEFDMKTSVETTELASREMMAIRWFFYHFIGPNCSKKVYKIPISVSIDFHFS